VIGQLEGLASIDAGGLQHVLARTELRARGAHQAGVVAPQDRVDDELAIEQPHGSRTQIGPGVGLREVVRDGHLRILRSGRLLARPSLEPG